MREQLPIDTELNGYQVDEVLWNNRLGTLYRATELDSRRTVSIQTLTSMMLENPIHPEDLTTHVEGLTGLIHPNIVETRSMHMSTEGPFIVQDYVPGFRLDHYLNQKGSLHWDLALRIMRQLLSALQYAHSANFLHHRLGPENIVIARGNTAKIMQFGLEHLIAGNSYRMPERLISNPSHVYTAPEHYNEDEKGDSSSDLYSLGLIAHEIITGKHLLGDSTLSFEGYSPFIANRMRYLEAIHPPLPEQLLNAIEIALERNPTRRFQDAESMIETLKDIELHSAQPRIKYHTRTGIPALLQRLKSRHVLITGLAFMLIIVAASMMVLPKKKNPFAAMGSSATEVQNNRSSRSLQQNAEAATGLTSKDQDVPVRIRAIDTNNRSIRGEIFINGESADAFTPTTLNIPSGSHIIQIKAQGSSFPKNPQKVMIRHDKTKRITIEVERNEAP